MAMTPPGPLAGIRILDTSDEKGAYCTRLLADLGADVIKVEPPEGDRLRRKGPFKDGASGPEASFAFATYHANKRGVTIDYRAPAGRERLLALAPSSDVVVTSFTPAEAKTLCLTVDDWRRANPDITVCSITAFGMRGPYADHRMTHLTSHAFGGTMFSQGDANEPPRSVPGFAMYDLAGAHAALAVQVALWERETAGPQVIDIAVHDTLCNRESMVTRYASAEVIQRRTGGGGTSGSWKCVDGPVEISPVYPRMWQGFVRLLGTPPELADPKWEDPVYRAQHIHEVRDLIASKLATMKRDDVVQAAQDNKTPSTLRHTPGTVLSDPHVAARGSLVEMDHPRLGKFRMPGAPYKTSDPTWSMRRPAPLLGQHNDEVLTEDASRAKVKLGDRPYASVKILSFGQALAGNEAASVLADLGADVLKIESPTFSDRNNPPLWADAKPVKEPSGMMTMHGNTTRSVKGISLEITNPEGKALFLRLVEGADVVLENYPAGNFEKWGIGWDVLSKVNPRIILLQMAGYGQTGPRRSYIGYGSNMSAFAGLTHLWGVTNGTHNDYIAGIHGPLAVLTALQTRLRTGRGVHIDLAQIEVGAALLAPYYAAASANREESPPPGNRVPGSAWSGAFRSQGEDRWVAIDLEDERDWKAFWTTIGREEVATDARFATPAARAEHGAELDALIESWTRTLTPMSAMHRLQRAGLAAAAVQNSEDVFYDPQLRVRDMIVVMDHPDLGPLEYPQSPVRMDKTRSYIRRPKTRFGEYNEEVYGGWLGLSASELESLHANKAI